MEKSKLVHRKVLPEMPVRVEYYTLTEKGKDLVFILEQMAAFSMRHEPKIFRDGKCSSF